jgi:hypothetical protein
VGCHCSEVLEAAGPLVESEWNITVLVVHSLDVSVERNGDEDYEICSLQGRLISDRFGGELLIGISGMEIAIMFCYKWEEEI